MHKQNVMCSYNETLFNNKKQSTDSCHNMDEPWKHYAEQKQPDTNVAEYTISFM